MKNGSLLYSKDPGGNNSTGIAPLFNIVWRVVGIPRVNLHRLQHLRRHLLDIILPQIVLQVLLLDQQLGRLLPCRLSIEQDVYRVHCQLDLVWRIFKTFDLVQTSLVDFLGRFTSLKQLRKRFLSLPRWGFIFGLRHILKH